MAVDMTAPEVQAAVAAETAKIQAQMEEKYKGLENNKAQILAEKKKLQEEYESVKSKFQGKDPEEIAKILDHYEKNAEAQMTEDERIMKRTEIMRRDFANKETALLTELEAERKRVKSLAEDKKRFVVDSKVREAAMKLVEPEFIDYAMRLGRETFSLTDTDEIVALNSDGTTILGRDGRSVLSPEDWLVEMQGKVPSMFKTSSGSGAKGSDAKSKGGVRFKEDLRDSAAKAKYIGDHGMEAYLDLPAKA
jgi:hypothetical protein